MSFRAHLQTKIEIMSMIRWFISVVVKTLLINVNKMVFLHMTLQITQKNNIVDILFQIWLWF